MASEPVLRGQEQKFRIIIITYITIIRLVTILQGTETL